MFNLGRLLDSIDDPEKDYYFFTVDVLSGKGVNYNTYENRTSIYSGKGIASELITTLYLHKYVNIRKIIHAEDILILFPDDVVEVTQTGKFTFNVKLITKGASRISAEYRCLQNTKEYVEKIIEDFIDSVRSNTILSLTRDNQLMSFYRRFCSKEEIEFLDEISKDKRFRTITDQVERKYEKIHSQAIKKLMKIKSELTTQSKSYSTLDYYRDFNQAHYEKIKVVLDEDRINKFSNFIENELILL